METHVIHDLSDSFMQLSGLSSIYQTVVAHQNIHPEQFYLTGYEGIFVNSDRRFLTDSVLSSLVPFDGSVVIVSTAGADGYVADACRALDIPFAVVSASDAGLADTVEAMFAAGRSCGHLFTASDIDRCTLTALGRLCRKYRRVLIVDCVADVLSIADMLDHNIDFVLANDSCSVPSGALLIARRSKLVQTEGVARSSRNDIYALWQNAMERRNPTLDPMSA